MGCPFFYAKKLPSKECLIFVALFSILCELKAGQSYMAVGNLAG